MKKSKPPHPTDTDESFVAEVSDLPTSRERRGRRSALWSARPLTGAGLSVRQRISRTLSTTAAIALAVLAIIVSMHGLPSLHLFERQPPRPTALHVSSADLSFLQDMAWSLDSKYIALLGCRSTQLGPCYGTQRYVPNALLIYEAGSGKLVTRIAPDAPVLTQLHALDPTDIPALPTTGAGGPPPGLQGVQVIYSQVLWSPDGRRLALPFLASVLPQIGLGLIWEGIVLVDSDGAHVRALFAPDLQSASPLWDMVAGKPLPLQAPSASTTPQEIPAALAYRWDSRDALVPEWPLMTDAVPTVPLLTPVGNPDGGATFTIWQPGEILPVSGPTIPSNGSGLFGYVFATAFVPWSPDGSRLAERSGRHPGAPLDMSAVLVPAGQLPPHSSGDTGTQQLAQFEYLPVRDRALQHLLDLGPVPNLAESGWIVAWRPDGRELAAYGISPPGANTKVITLYDCATGRTLATLQPLSGSVFLDGNNDGMLRWSPDGTRLLAYIQGSSTLTIWGPSQLP
jgi:hypothetical protein